MKSFAESLGISFAAYQNYEYGKRIPPGPVLARLSELGGRSIDWILTGREGAVAEIVAEPSTSYGEDEIMRQIVNIVRLMDDESRREVLKHIEEKMQAAAWRKERDGK